MKTYEEQTVEENVLEVEALVDRFTLCGLLEILSMVCLEKSEHVRINWQDQKLASRWMIAAHKLENAAKAKYTASI